MRDFVPEYSTDQGAPLDSLDELWPGVEGFAMSSPENDDIYIPYIRAIREGNGDVGRFLDALDKRCVFPNVFSRKLRGMLVRRGWKTRMEDSGPHFGHEEMEVWYQP
jgi:hypothetical protein